MGGNIDAPSTILGAHYIYVAGGRDGKNLSRFAYSQFYEVYT